ncbi:hypothetical protein BJX66DRAFT_340850 [Aspergillus keveii]|uniref:LysM domain-containing protein n=1 Tax=Aspergillus keveii TaxID=714993 RepID=A0ABR4FXR8_9EURO
MTINRLVLVPIPVPTPVNKTLKCGEYYLVESGEDCGIVTTQFEIPLDDFLFLNPQVWENCTNLMRDYYYCVRPVGYIMTYPGYGGSTTTEPFEQAPSTPLPKDPVANYPSSWLIIPIATRTKRETAGISHLRMSRKSLAANCWNLAAIVSASTATPIETPAPHGSGEVANCTLWYAPADQDDTCVNMLNTFGITFEQLYAMNPSVHNDCSGLVLGTYYCISTYPDGVPGGQPDWTGPTVTVPPSTPATTTTASSGISTPSPVQTGIISTCNEFYRAISGDTCYDIALENEVPLSDFYTWNPAVKSDCSGLQADVYVCVGVQPPSSTTTTGTTSTSGISTPSPVQSGMTTACNDFYFVVAGDGCYNIAQDNAIPLSSFYDWNPAVKTDCSGLQASVYVCVGIHGGNPTATTTTAITTTRTTTTTTGISTPTPTQPGMVRKCRKFYLVQSGDGCWDLANQQGISLADFYAWNPAVKSDCSGLQANVYVCVGLN